MTIINDWCPTCEDGCSDHATMCTVCGDSLVSRPMSERGNRSTSTTLPRAVPVDALNTLIRRPVQEQMQESTNMVQEMRESNQELTDMLSNLRQRVSSIRQLVSDISEQQQQLTQGLPPEAMDPQAAGSRSRPTAKRTLEELTRIVIQHNSSLQQQSVLRLVEGQTAVAVSFQPVCADFGPPAPHEFKNKKFVVPAHRTGKTGISDCTDSIVYMERGDGVTFCQKALLAQQAGAVAVVIGNNTNASWPYVMRDSKGEAPGKLQIPVVMVSQSDGQELCKMTTSSCCCDLEISSAPKECNICVETLRLGETAVQLPVCNHVFHEACAMMWLKNHNTCPYCRHELPTDNEEYEAERRREQRTHATGSSSEMSGSTEANSQAFYG